MLKKEIIISKILVDNNPDKIRLLIKTITTIIHQTIINQITHLQMQTALLILVMMIYHSNYNESIKLIKFLKEAVSMIGGTRIGGCRRKKVCYLTANGITHIDYKDTELLKRFISELGKILPRRVTGTSSKYQRMLTL